MIQTAIDIHLLVPCQCSDISRFQFHETKDEYGQLFIENLDKCNNTDFSSSYVRNLRRHCLGVKRICVTDAQGEELAFPCFGIISIHEQTNLAVVDIVVPGVTKEAHRIVEFFRSKHLMVGGENESQLVDGWLSRDYGLTTVGEHRCIVFSGGRLSESEKINFLAAECEPMGSITGSDFLSMSSNNIAQYNTAEAYVSEVTLLEISNNYKPNLSDRLAEQAIEVFFLKLILLQDAAICSVNLLIENAINDENERRKNTDMELLRLVTELSKATKFFDPRNFYYPTVRASFVRIADRFGLPAQIKLMSENKSLLEQLIEINSIQSQKKENEIINLILIILAVIQVMPIFMGDQRTLFYTGVTSAACIIFIIILRRRLFLRKKHRRG